MFLCDELIYIQMQQTGCTHIASILGRLVNGELIGKHNPASPDQIRHTRFFLSSIRNPWDWYLSLWTYGVSRKGALWERLVNRDVIGGSFSALGRPTSLNARCTSATTTTTRSWNWWHSETVSSSKSSTTPPPR